MNSVRMHTSPINSYCVFYKATQCHCNSFVFSTLNDISIHSWNPKSPAMLAMSRSMSATMMCGVLALFVLGDARFSERIHRFSMLDVLIRGRHHNDRREDIGASREVTRKGEETCTPSSDEYSTRLEALLCNEDYLRGVREEIERSNCTNEIYRHNEHLFPCAIFDERVNISLCSEECSLTQVFYVYCKYLGEERLNIDRECGLPVAGAGICSFNDKNFCHPQLDNISSDLGRVSDECFRESNATDAECTDKCREAVENLMDTHGCCVHFFYEYYLYYIFDFDRSSVDEMPFTDLFPCGVETPKVCRSLSPPDEFVDCAHDGDVHVSPTVFFSIALIMLSLFSTLYIKSCFCTLLLIWNSFHSLKQNL